jgi:hypothetical protein
MIYATREKISTILFFAITGLLVFAEYFRLKEIVIAIKPMLIPSIGVIYFLAAKKKCYWYIFALFFAFLSNVLLLFSNPTLLLLGIVAFLFYRIASIFSVIRNGDKILILPLILASIPFLFAFSYLIYLMVSPDHPTFYATVLNDIIISIFSGIGLSSYFMNDSKQNSWLLISTLLFAFLVLLFMLENFYISFHIFKPLSALVFSVAHYAFLKFLIEAKN